MYVQKCIINPNGYDNKPYIGILVNKNDRKYVIPLSSAKDKHKTWKKC